MIDVVPPKNTKMNTNENTNIIANTEIDECFCVSGHATNGRGCPSYSKAQSSLNNGRAAAEEGKKVLHGRKFDNLKDRSNRSMIKSKLRSDNTSKRFSVKS